MMQNGAGKLLAILITMGMCGAKRGASPDEAHERLH
jgi:hypothetical protein